MTYCVAMCVDEGLVFLSDTRTNAGVDHVSAARKMSVFEQPGDRVLVLMGAGNLSLTQSVVQLLSEPGEGGRATLWNAPNMAEAARVVGDAVREVHQRDAGPLEEFDLTFNCSFILGGQIKGLAPRLFMIYSAGNFIESTRVSPYFQIGESKYGKPIVDRVITPATPLDEAAKCALISMDSTLRSNLSVGLPLDLLVYERDALKVTRFAVLDQENAYYRMIHRTWGERLRQIFGEIPNPAWTDPSDVPLRGRHTEVSLPRALAPDEIAAQQQSPAQTLAEAQRNQRQQ
ncbi:proteasome-type protease [Robbsia sp. Bb-Pol-6]|uniref:Proteasome-type protease n=1 Tax=Robbsia betulipollinis TaxID=2981849 RepID=A0ABT3ZMD5_9BURK|nr:proteasome-type protease [Robbsia betulipollinis]MCY0387703.1 proteasome-type protease [Robbsia betulipollinis]